MKLDLIKVFLIGALIFGVIFGFAFIYNGAVSGNNAQKIDKIKIISYLKNLKNEADLYYASNLNYGQASKEASSNCSMSVGFLNNKTSVNTLTALSKAGTIRCLFQGEEIVDRWAVIVGVESGYFCLDTAGNVAESKISPTNIDCN